MSTEPRSDDESSSVSVLTIRKSAAPLRREVVDALRLSIVRGQLSPGERLIERQLISMTGVSRTVIREALRQLESEGLVDVVPNKGVIVRKLTIDEAHDLYAIRAVLEGLAARMFVEKANQNHIHNITRELEATIEAYRVGNPEKTIESKNRFYKALFAGAQSETLSSMIDALHARIWRWRVLGHSHPLRSPGRSEETIRALQDLTEAVSARDSERAEKIAHNEATKAAAKVMRILRSEPAQTIEQ